MKNINRLSFFFPNNIGFSLLFFLLIISSACNKEDQQATGESSLKQVLDALGGENTVASINTISYKANSSTYEHGQEQPHDLSPINGNNHSYRYSSELNARKVKIAYDSIVFIYPFSYQTNGALMTINDQKGTLSGQYNWSSYYLGDSGPKSLYSSRIEAVLKNQFMSNPIELLKNVLINNSNSINTQDQSFSISTIIPDHNIKIKIDPDTHLPQRAQVLETDFLYGDVLFEVVYENWKVVGETQYPSQLKLLLDGDIIKSETLSEINVNPVLSSDHFETEAADLKAYDTQQAAYGFLSSQWYHRLFAGGIPLDQPVNNGAIVLEDFDLSSFGMRDQTIGPRLKLIGRPDASNWSAAIQTSTGVVVVEAPLNPRWTGSILNAIKNKFPGENIEGVIVSHTHYDHFGGIREIAPEAGTIYIGTNGVAKTEKVLNSKHELVPDAMTGLSAASINIKPVSGITYLDNGFIEIHLLKTDDDNGNSHTTDNSHSEDMVVVYVPEYETIIQADFLYCGIFLGIWNGQTAYPFTGSAREDLKERAKFLVEYIEEKGLNVSTVVGIHGGVSSYDELVNVSN